MGGVVDGERVGGGVVGGSVGGTTMVVVGGGGGFVIVLVGGAVVSGGGGGGGGGGGSAGGLVVCTGGEVVPGATVPVPRGAVVPTGGRVVTVGPPGPGATVVVVGSTVEEVDGGKEVDVVVTPKVVVGRTVVEVADCVATCCLGELSLPVATSNRRAAKATVARAYSPTLKR